MYMDAIDDALVWVGFFLWKAFEVAFLAAVAAAVLWVLCGAVAHVGRCVASMCRNSAPHHQPLSLSHIDEPDV